MTTGTRKRIWFVRFGLNCPHNLQNVLAYQYNTVKHFKWSCLFVFLPDCKHHLCEPELKLVWPSSKLLQAACSASNRASHIITAAVMPSLVEQYNSRAQVKQGQLLSKGLFSLT